MEQNKYVDKLLKLTKGATSQFHTVLETKKQLEEAGFEEVALRENWDLKRGGSILWFIMILRSLHLQSGKNLKVKMGSVWLHVMEIFQDFVSNQIQRS